MSNTDPAVPRLETVGTREPLRGGPPRTIGGTLATMALLLGGLFAAAASPAVLVGGLLGVAVGVGAAVVGRRDADEATRICLSRTGVCIRL